MEFAFERRPNARIVRSAQDEIRAIQTLLADVYRDAGDGRTLLRELVQNADDAEAGRLIFSVVDRGVPDAHNTLLRGPGLLIANDGPFLDRDWNALHQALGDAKSADTGKIGRFGVGLKSVFHICEAFVYLGAEHDARRLRTGVLNPWAGTGKDSDNDPLHPDWDTVDNGDSQVLLEAARSMLGSFTAGLLLWIPLRCSEHLDRAQKDQPYGLGSERVDPKSVVAWFERPDSLALLLSQCGHLRSVEAGRAATIREWANRITLVHVDRPDFERFSWVGRYRGDAPRPTRAFKGKIHAGDDEWSVIGVDAIGHDGLSRIRSESNWPSDRVFTEGRSVLVPRKALAHAALCCTGGALLPAEYACVGPSSCRSMTRLHHAPALSSRPCNAAPMGTAGTSSCMAISGRLTTEDPSPASRMELTMARASPAFEPGGIAEFATS